jgi:hypothetical protein
MTHLPLPRALTLALVCLPFVLPAQSPAGRTGTATVTGRAPVIDGHLSDDAWRAASPLSGFTQREPQEGTAVSERTEVRLLTDGE